MLIGRRGLGANKTRQAASLLQVLRVLRHLLAALQPHIRLLPVRTIARKLASPPFFPRIIRRAHRSHLHLEDRLHRFLDLGLRRFRRHLEYQRVLSLFNAEAFFGDHRLLNNLIRGFHQATSALVFDLRRRRAGFFFSSTGSASCERRVADFFSEFCSFSSDSRKSFVFGSFTSNDFTTISLPSANFDASAERSAPNSFFFGKA